MSPYLVFAARTPASQHTDAEFIVGNIFTDTDIAQRLDDYKLQDRYQVGTNATYESCSLNSGCGKGCPAAVVAAGGRIGEVDAEQCPVTTADQVAGERRLLPLMLV